MSSQKERQQKNKVLEYTIIETLYENRETLVFRGLKKDGKTSVILKILAQESASL